MAKKKRSLQSETTQRKQEKYQVCLIAFCNVAMKRE